MVWLLVQLLTTNKELVLPNGIDLNPLFFQILYHSYPMTDIETNWVWSTRRTVVSIPNGPSALAVKEAAWGLARYAAISQVRQLIRQTIFWMIWLPFTVILVIFIWGTCFLTDWIFYIGLGQRVGPNCWARNLAWWRPWNWQDFWGGTEGLGRGFLLPCWKQCVLWGYSPQAKHGYTRGREQGEGHPCSSCWVHPQAAPQENPPSRPWNHGKLNHSKNLANSLLLLHTF